VALDQCPLWLAAESQSLLLESPSVMVKHGLTIIFHGENMSKPQFLMVNSTQRHDAWRQARLGLAQAMHDTRAKSRLKAVDLVMFFLDP
jgi:hypothetical protein